MAAKPNMANSLLRIEVPHGTGGDQAYALEAAADYFQKIETIVGRAVQERDPDLIVGALTRLFQTQHLSGFLVARLAGEARKRWASISETDFYTYLFAYTGKSTETIRRYADVWDMLESVQAPATRRLLMNFPMKDLIVISQARNEHRQFTEAEYALLAKAGTSSELRQLRDKLLKRNVAASKRLVFYLDRQGTLFASKGRKRVVVGAINLDLASTDPIQAEAVQRLLTRLEILQP